MNQLDFENKYSYYDWIDIPNGTRAAIAKTLDLQQTISVLLMSGYIGRNPIKPDYARKSREIYDSIQAKDGHNLENYVTTIPTPTTASGLTIIGESGLGKSTNLANILFVRLHRMAYIW